MWTCRLQENYSSFDDFAQYDAIYNLAKRLGFDSTESAWRENPRVQGSTNPDDFKACAKYEVGRYQNGKFVCIVSGMGKNRGKWDSGHSRSAAYRHARQLRAEHPNLSALGLEYRVLRT